MLSDFKIPTPDNLHMNHFMAGFQGSVWVNDKDLAQGTAEKSFALVILS